MTVRRFLLLVLLCAACNKPQAPKTSQPAAPAGPSVRATVVTIRTTIQPGNRQLTHTLSIANGRARAGNEVDSWRLYDVEHNAVTYVDDLAHTYRTVPMAKLLATRKQALAGAVPDMLPRATMAATGAKKTLQGVEAREYVITMGGYQRHLWIATHSAIPPQLFAMMQASDEVVSPLAATTRAADDVMTTLRGFPLADHAELQIGDKTMVVDREVISIEQRDVPADWLNVRGDYQQAK